MELKLETFQYVSIDIETLGLNPETCDVIEVGAVLETITRRVDLTAPPLETLPRFHTYITKPFGVYQGEPYAMWLNAAILKRIADHEAGYNYTPGDCLDQLFTVWLSEHIEDLSHKRVTFAGKNFAGFDLQFLDQLGFGEGFKIHHRCLDPGSMFFNPWKDKEVPGLRTCLERSNIKKEIDHTAIEDSLDVIQCIRSHYGVVTDNAYTESD